MTEEILNILNNSVVFFKDPTLQEQQMSFLMNKSFLATLYFDILDFLEGNGNADKDLILNRINTLKIVTQKVSEDLWPQFENYNKISSVFDFNQKYEISGDIKKFYITLIKYFLNEVYNESSNIEEFIESYISVKKYFSENNNNALSLVLAVAETYLFFGKKIKSKHVIDFMQKQIV